MAPKYFYPVFILIITLVLSTSLPANDLTVKELLKQAKIVVYLKNGRVVNKTVAEKFQSTLAPNAKII